MTIPPDFIEQLKARIPLAETVARRVDLRKQGREFIGLCPFHKEKSPSFTVSEEKGFFHCFGCGAHGTVIDFVMRTDGLSFPEAVDKLAQQANMSRPRMSRAEREAAERRKGLHEIMAAAAEWFQAQLSGAGGGAARSYLAHRGVHEETIGRFGLGYAPDRRDLLKQAMTARGVSEDGLVEAGLIIRPDDGQPSYDRFRHRLIFPISDRRGRTIAFGGRALGEARAKYLNSPETPLFRKGRVLYNLAGARRAASEAQTVIVAEGYMDVIALTQAGLANAVAPLGTAVTEEQLGELWRIASEPVFCLDGDAAGWRAALNVAERALALLRPGYSLRFALLPSGRDPDDLIAAEGPSAMHQVLAVAKPLSAVLWRMAAAGAPLDTPERRAAFEAKLDQLTRRIRDPKVRGHYERHFRDRLWETFRASRSSERSGKSQGPSGRSRAAASRSGNVAAASARLAPPDRHRRREEKIMALFLIYPQLIHREYETLAEVVFRSRDLDSLRNEIIDIANRHGELDSSALGNHLATSGFSELVNRITGLGAGGTADAKPDVAHDLPEHQAETMLHQMLEQQRAVDADAELLKQAGIATADDESWARFAAAKRHRLLSADEREADADRLRESLERGREY